MFSFCKITVIKINFHKIDRGYFTFRKLINLYTFDVWDSHPLRASILDHFHPSLKLPSSNLDQPIIIPTLFPPHQDFIWPSTLISTNLNPHLPKSLFTLLAHSHHTHFHIDYTKLLWNHSIIYPLHSISNTLPLTHSHHTLLIEIAPKWP